LVATKLLLVLNPATNSAFSEAKIYGSHPESVRSQRKTDYFLSMRSTYLNARIDSTILLEFEATPAKVKHTIIHQFMSLIHSRENS
jgi:hypothetical protein